MSKSALTELTEVEARRLWHPYTIMALSGLSFFFDPFAAILSTLFISGLNWHILGYRKQKYIYWITSLSLFSLYATYITVFDAALFHRYYLQYVINGFVLVLVGGHLYQKMLPLVVRFRQEFNVQYIGVFNVIRTIILSTLFWAPIGFIVTYSAYHYSFGQSYIATSTYITGTDNSIHGRAIPTGNVDAGERAIALCGVQLLRTINNNSCHVYKQYTMTDEDGLFLFEDIPAGRYMIFYFSNMEEIDPFTQYEWVDEYVVHRGTPMGGVHPLDFRYEMWHYGKGLRPYFGDWLFSTENHDVAIAYPVDRNWASHDFYRLCNQHVLMHEKAPFFVAHDLESPKQGYYPEFFKPANPCWHFDPVIVRVRNGRASQVEFMIPEVELGPPDENFRGYSLD